MRDLIELIKQRLISILKSSRHNNSLGQANLVHSFMCEQQLELHPVLGSYLVPMLVECERLPDAQHVFDRLAPQDRNEYLWNSIIIGHSDCGDPKLALQFYHRMQHEAHRIQPNRYTYLALLNACATLTEPEHGRLIHADIVRRGLENYIYSGSAVIGNTLIDMYGKCGCLPEAHQVLTNLPVQNTVSWAALIAGYAEYGLCEEVDNCLQKMQVEGVSHDPITLVCSLRACASIGALEIGQKLHAEITKRGFDMMLFVANTLVDLYGKCDSLAEACGVFNGLSVPDVVSWAALIAAYAEQGFAEEVRNCVQKMQLEGITPDSVIFICSLKACGIIGALDTGRDIHTEIIKRGLESDLLVGSTLADSYGKCGSVTEARWVFDMLPIQNRVSWNALIAGYADLGLGKEAGSCLWEMQRQGIAPDSGSFLCSLKACGTMTTSEVGQEIHAELIKRGIENEMYIGSMLVDMYTRCGFVAEGQQVFDKLPVHCAASWAALIVGYTKHGCDEEAGRRFKHMQLSNVFLDSATLLCSLKACGTIGALEVGQEIHAEITRRGLEKEQYMGIMLIDMYGKCGSVTEGRQVFDKLPARGVAIWTAMIKAYGESHVSNMAVKCFEDMQNQGTKPDSTAFTCVLAACSRASLVTQGRNLFQQMRVVHKIEPTMDHYACMVDLFARSGNVYEAEKFIAGMQCSPCWAILRSMLSACNIYGEVELGERLFQQLLEANREDASAFSLMTDMYASAGRWNDAIGVEEMRKDTGATKKPGTASIEVKKELHEFAVNGSHSKGITEVFKMLSSRMKYEGYLPNLDVISTCIEKESATYEVAGKHLVCSTDYNENIIFSKSLGLRNEYAIAV